MAERYWKNINLGSNRNTRIIGCLEIIRSVAGIVLTVLAMNTPNFDAQSQGPKKSAISIVIVILWVTSFGMAIVLLRGSYNNSPGRLDAWITVTAIVSILLVIGGTLQFLYSHSGVQRDTCLLLTFLSFPITLCFMKVVNDNKKELEALIDDEEVKAESQDSKMCTRF
ncbi:unnamed protein product [Allacma fusca]|uniref:Uncharacterized protein n=1 Tax=Allacma fusca TaxID=39272 RepID=A0A8J2NTN3_9HEXA|nr:unnamed protein product [Allacma fusca]